MAVRGNLEAGKLFLTGELLLSVGMRMAGGQERAKDPVEMKAGERGQPQE